MNNIQFDQKIKGSQRRPLQSVRSGCVGRVFIALMAIIFVMGFVSAAQAGFTYRKPVTVHNSQVSGGADFPDFPVAVIINNDSDLMTTANGGHVEHALGYDIVFKDTGGTQLDYEIEQYDGTTGSLVAWVEVPSLKVSTDTVIYIYYGDSSISAPPHTPTAVWDTSDGWRGVWHLHDTGGDAQDSTYYDRDGTVSGTVTRGAGGQIDGSYDFGSYGRVDIGDPSDGHLDFGTGNFTVSLWLNVDQSTGADQVALYKGAYGSGGASSEDVYYFDGYGAEQWANYPNMTDGGTVQHAWTHRSGDVQLLNSNTSGGGGGAGGWASPTGWVGEACGDEPPENYFIDGDTNTYWGCEDIDDHWIKLDMGESKSMTKFRIYVQGDQYYDRWPGLGAYVSDNPTNWGDPVFTNWDVTQNNGWQESPEFSKSGRYIYLFSADRFQELRMNEFEAAIAADVSGSGIISKVELRAHGAAYGGSPNDDDMILRPVFGGTSDGDDHQVEMGDYDNGGKVWSEWVDITNDTNAPATWSWDDVANLDCDAQFVVVGNEENMLCSLVEIRVTTGGSADPGYSLTTDSSGQNMVFQISDGSGIKASPAAGLTVDTWHHIVGVVDRSADRIRIYKDGTEVGSGTDIAAIGSLNTTEDLLFPWGASGDYDLDGLLDEVRISNTARSADWIMTEYNNQSSPATFHTIGAEEGLAVTYTISAVAGANGGISPSGAVSVPAGESQTFSITADAGYVILAVLVDGLSAGAVSSYPFTNVNADHTISASFIQPGDYVIYTTAIGNGSISPAGPVAVIEGGSRTFTIIPDGGEQIDEVWVDDVPIGAVTSYTFSNVTADHTIKAQFTETPPSEDLTDCVQISDTPLDAQFRSAPANIMFLLDDSGSMDWEFMNSDASGEMFEGSQYVFDNPGDNGSGDILSDAGRKHWKSQWSGYNTIYYNTHTTYEPWPSTTLDTFGPADTSTPRSHPQYAIPMFDLRDEYTQIIDGAAVISVTRAHYYTWHDVNEDGVLDAGETRYLVNFVGSFPGGNLNAREWYVFNDVNADDVVQGNELTPISASSVPISVKPKSFGDDLQNFANWYSYYRRRELTAIATVASVITHAQGMQVGLYSIHGRINITVQKIKVDGVDETATLLHELYANYNSADMTPLRTGLLSIGKYFHKNDSDDGGIGPSPYADADDGGECQQSFVIVMTDGYYNGAEPWNPAKNYDGDNGEPYADSYSNTLADIAMYYYENDLVSELGDSVPMNDRDTATHQHMVTYGIGFGVDGVLNPSQIDFESGIYPVWPNPTGGDQEKIDDLWHASVNGRGRFFSAKNYNELIADLLSILQDIQLMGASASAVSVNGDELYMKINSDVLMFQSKYYSEAWHGDVLAFRLNDVTGEIIEPAVWSAAQSLSSQTADSRKIVTFDGISAGMPFRFTGLEDQQKSLLDPGWQSDGGALAQNIVDYLRGDPSNEQDNGGSFRNRTWSILDPGHPYDGNIITSSKLGDIVHSSPVYKNGMLYWGGNDGMLHAVEASTGEELFAYVPNLVFKNFADLTDPAYLHKYYVDLTPTVKNVDISGVTTMLVGGLGKGGRGYFALDVSNMKPLEGSVPSSENEVAAMAMWEYPNLNTPSEEITDLGYSFSKATIVESYDTDDAPSIVIFGNGYNSPNGHAVLFILNPLTGELIKKIDTQAGSCNGLSTPIATDVNYDGKVDYVYAGDLDGNLWKFDLTDSDYNNWDVAYDQGGISRPLFKTDNQPITTKPNVMYHCEEDGYMVIFGTGRYLGIDDLSDSSQQAIYGIWDYGDDVDDGEYVGSFNSGVLTGNNLTGSVSVLAQTVVNEQTVNDTNLRVLSENDPDWMTSTTDGVSCGEALGVAKCDLNGVGQDADPLRNVGWYLNLPASRERVVSDVLVKDGKLIVVSFMPDASMCGTGGSSWLMTMNACSGDRFQEAQFDTNGDGVIDDQDLINIGTAQDPIMVPPTGIEYAGRLQPPAIIVLENGQEILHMSSSSGEIKSVTEKSADLGITFWKVFRP